MIPSMSEYFNHIFLSLSTSLRRGTKSPSALKRTALSRCIRMLTPPSSTLREQAGAASHVGGVPVEEQGHLACTKAPAVAHPSPYMSHEP